MKKNFKIWSGITRVNLSISILAPRSLRLRGLDKWQSQIVKRRNIKQTVVVRVFNSYIISRVENSCYILDLIRFLIFSTQLIKLLPWLVSRPVHIAF